MKKSIWGYGMHIMIILLLSIINIIQGNWMIAIYLLLFLLVGEKLKGYWMSHSDDKH